MQFCSAVVLTSAFPFSAKQPASGCPSEISDVTSPISGLSELVLKCSKTSTYKLSLPAGAYMYNTFNEGDNCTTNVKISGQSAHPIFRIINVIWYDRKPLVRISYPKVTSPSPRDLYRRIGFHCCKYSPNLKFKQKLNVKGRGIVLSPVRQDKSATYAIRWLNYDRYPKTDY